MALPMVNGVAYGWSNITLILFQVPVVGIVDISFNEKQAKENVMGWGEKPIARGSGNFEYEGSIELYVEEWKKIIAASPGRNPLKIPPFDIPILYGGSRVKYTKDTLKFVEFLENPFNAKQGDTKLTVKIPLIIGDIER
jgi:hypothetical protein